MYKLIAFDMDGTLLNSEKKISDKTVEAINKAIEAGKIVILNTGRCPAELKEYREVLPRLRYVNCVSGALVYDYEEERSIYESPLSEEEVKTLIQIGKETDEMVHLMDITSVVEKDKVPRMNDYYMGVYQSMYEEVTTQVDNIYDYYVGNPYSVHKLNIYHHSKAARDHTRKAIKEAGLELEMKDSGATGLEMNAKGIDKGTGLKQLCHHLGISIEETIVVGDADNDKEALETAGLAVAMGNAKESIKEISDVIVSDNDHDGCTEVIEKYILEE